MLHALSEALFIITIIIQIVEITVICDSAVLMIDVFFKCLVNIILVEWSIKVAAVYDSVM